jgi:integrase
MSRALNKISTKAFEAFRGPGSLADGGNLYLVATGSSVAWSFIYTWQGKRRQMGLGSKNAVGLAAARALAAKYRDVLATGVDPIAARRLEKSKGTTFRDCADAYLAAHGASWRSERTRELWTHCVEVHCRPLHRMGVADVTVEDVVAVVNAVEATPAIAQRTLSVIRRTIDLATAKGLRPVTAGNPADYRIIGQVAPIRLANVNNPAMAYSDVPAFVASLRAKDTALSRCLELIIRTGVRKTEGAEATFAEFDLDAAIWTIPAERMKSNREHVVPLTARCVEIVRHQRKLHPHLDHVFPGKVRGASIHRNSLQALVPEGATVHGMRSALRDWLGNETNVDRETAELILAHTFGDATERAYRRSTAISKRRRALELWGDHIDCVPGDDAHQGANVVRFQTVAEGAR